MSGTVILIIRILLALSLYLFLGWVLWAIYQDIRQHAQIIASRKPPTITIRIRHPNRPQIERQFSSPEITIGRDPLCDIRLDDEAVSARHAQLLFHHGQWWLEDNQSKNGTFLNGEKLVTPTVLVNEDEVECGRILLIIRLVVVSINPSTQQIAHAEENELE